MQILGIGQGTRSPVVTTRLRAEWTHWAAAAGFERFLLLLDKRAVHPGLGLGAAQAAEPDIAAGFTQRAVHRLDLSQHGVARGALRAAGPQIAPQRLDLIGWNRFTQQRIIPDLAVRSPP